MSNIIVGLDIGTCNIRVVIAEKDPENHLQIIGLAKTPSKGLRNGVIVNIDAAVSSIKEAIEAAEQIAGVEVTSVYTAIGGSQVESINSSGQVGVDQSGRNRATEINKNTKKRAIDCARAFPLSLDKMPLHTIPQEYIIDGTSGYDDPLGIMGVRLEVKVHLVNASITAFSNIKECILRAGYEMRGLMLKTLVCAQATVHKDEMDLGSILIDLGGGTTDVMVLFKGAPVISTSIPLGGNMVTSDIAYIKGISNSAAEKIKLESGTCWITENEINDEVIIPGVGGRPPEKTNKLDIYQIIQPRVEEIMQMVKDEVIRKSACKKLNGGIILTGGGALMPGIIELTQSIWGTTAVRIGTVADLGGIDNSYQKADFATAAGLVIAKKDDDSDEKSHHSSHKNDEKNKSFLGSLKDFLGNFF